MSRWMMRCTHKFGLVRCDFRRLRGFYLIRWSSLNNSEMQYPATGPISGNLHPVITKKQIS